MKRNLCLLALLCFFFKLPAQNNPSNTSGLAIGDQVPDVAIVNLLNHPTGKANISDYRGKWLILDFWATWCSPCISMFPKSDSLQKTFQDKVSILPITYEDESKVTRLFNKVKILKGLKPPMVVNDSILHALFPHRELPHYVWINPKGIVVATTDHRQVTAANIEAQLAKKESVLENKIYVRSPFNKNELLLAGNTEIVKPVRYQSVLLPYIEGLSIGYTIFPTDPKIGKRILATNSRLLSLFQLAHSGQDIYFTNNRTIIEVEDRSAFVAGVSGKAYSNWLQDGNAWCYELIVPANQEERAMQIMREDMQRFFPQYIAAIEERKRPCLALVRTNNKDSKIKAKPLETRGGEYEADLSLLGGEIRNGLLVDLVARLNAYFLQNLSTPIIDETGYTGRIDLALDANMSNVASIREALQEYGLDLVEVDRKIKVLVISDNVNNKKSDI